MPGELMETVGCTSEFGRNSFSQKYSIYPLHAKAFAITQIDTIAISLPLVVSANQVNGVLESDSIEDEIISSNPPGFCELIH